MKTDRQRLRSEYFRARGLEPPAEDAEKRRQQALYFINQHVPPDLEAALVLFDPDEDKDNDKWLLMVGWIYDQHIENPYFDAEKAFQFFSQASAIGNGTASYNLAIKYVSGLEQEIDIDAAIFWLERAKEQKEREAGYQIADIKRVFDGRYYDPQETIFQMEVHAAISKSDDDGSTFGEDAIASIIGGGGRHYKRNHEFTIARYKYLQKKEVRWAEETTRYLAIWKLAIRIYLGLGAERDNEEARRLLDKIPERSSHALVTQVLNENAKRLRAIIESDINNKAQYEVSRSFIKEIIEYNSDPSAIKAVDIKESDIDIIWCVEELAMSEKWVDRFKWRERLRTAQAASMGLRYEDIRAATLFAGPRYNPVASNGMPVLGVWEAPSPNESVAEQQMMDAGSYVPEAGIVKLKGVVGNPNGTLSFDCIKTSDSPALLVAEDFEVAMVLAFGDPEGLLHPYLSLEDPRRHGIEEDRYAIFKFKEWNPHWLGYTDLGRTLYVTDQLIGAICWNPREFEVGASDRTFDPRAAEYGLELLEDIAMTGGRYGAGSYSRVMLVPENISCPVSKDASGRLHAEVREVKMRIDGDYIIKGEGKEKDIHLSRNDDMYLQGRTVNKLTRRYNDIAAMMPVFARAQELMALMHATRQLRESGFALEASLRERVMARYEKLQGMPALPRHEQLCVSLPLVHKRV